MYNHAEDSGAAPSLTASQPAGLQARLDVDQPPSPMSMDTLDGPSFVQRQVATSAIIPTNMADWLLHGLSCLLGVGLVTYQAFAVSSAKLTGHVGLQEASAVPR